jgi:hypothetical protein
VEGSVDLLWKAPWISLQLNALFMYGRRFRHHPRGETGEVPGELDFLPSFAWDAIHRFPQSPLLRMHRAVFAQREDAAEVIEKLSKRATLWPLRGAIVRHPTPYRR